MSDVTDLDRLSDAEYLRRRYGGGREGDRRPLWAVAGTLIAIALAWFIWQAVALTRTTVNAEAVAIDPVSDSQVDVTFNVLTSPGTTVTCTVRAYTPNLTEVGVKEVTVGPVSAEVTTVVTSVVTIQPATGARVGDCTIVHD